MKSNTVVEAKITQGIKVFVEAPSDKHKNQHLQTDDNKNNRLDASDLFSLFTANIIKGGVNWVNNTEHKEGKVAKAIEEQTAKLPSDVFLWAALASMGVSLTLKLAGRRHNSLFIGQWAAPFLLLGVYNKLVKLKGHDRES